MAPSKFEWREEDLASFPGGQDGTVAEPGFYIRSEDLPPWRPIRGVRLLLPSELLYQLSCFLFFFPLLLALLLCLFVSLD